MRKTRTGASLLAALLLAAATVCGMVQRNGSYALVAGTVFRESGFSLPAAEVTITVKTPPAGVKRFKQMRAISDSRGEFAFRVPPGKAEYSVSVRAEGYLPAGKDVAVNGEERLDVYLELQPAGSDKKK